MTPRNKQRLSLALDNAAKMIRGHVETGLFPEDVGEDDESGIKDYVKACKRAFKMISTLADKYK